MLFLINSLEGGGAEKVMTRLAGQFAQMREDLDLGLAILDNVPEAYPVPSGVDVFRLDARGSFRRSITETKTLIRSWRPDAVLSFLTRANCAAVLARRNSSFRCVISERVNTTSHFGNSLRGRAMRAVVALLYCRADAVVAVSQGVADELSRRYRVPASRLSVIGNPVDIDDLASHAAAAPDIGLPDDFMVSVGRLVPNKGGDIVLRAFARHRNRTRRLVMLGEGPERAQLAALARDLGIADRVSMPGHVQNPHAIVGRATALISASRSEGFPNAIAEALAVGCPVVATDCQSGPAEILADKATGDITSVETAPWGILVPVDDAAALGSAMDVLDDPERRKDYSGRARERARFYAARSIADEYTRVLGV